MHGRVSLNAFIHAAITGDEHIVAQYLRENTDNLDATNELDHEGHIALMRAAAANSHPSIAFMIGDAENKRSLVRENETLRLEWNAKIKAKPDVKYIIALGAALYKNQQAGRNQQVENGYLEQLQRTRK